MATTGTTTPPVTTARTRSATVDLAKGLGIALVVIGHTIRGLDETTLPDWIVSVDRWIYAFHMPLFFLLSGLFIERSVRGTFSIMLNKKTATIVYPYLLWSVAQEVVRSGTGARTDPLSSIWTVVYEPVMQFWFLYVLFVGTVLFVGLRKAGVSLLALTGIAALLYLTRLLDVQIGTWSVFYLFRTYFIFFVLGALCTRYEVLALVDRVRPAIAGAVAVAGFAIVTVWTAVEAPQVFDLPVALVGSFATILVARLIAEGRAANLFTLFGLASFEIYVAHTMFSGAMRVALERVVGVTTAAPQLLFGVMIGIAGPLALRWFAQRMNAPWIFRAPTIPARDKR